MLVCAHCDSQFIVNDKEFVAGTGWVERPRCMKCGRDKFKEVETIQPVKPANNITQNYSSPMQVGENIAKKQAKSVMLEPKKEEPMSKLPKCKVEGCTRIGGVRGFCADHFHQEYGISYDTYLRHRKGKDEDPQAVAARWTDKRVKVKSDHDAIKEEKAVEDCKPEEEKRMARPKKKCDCGKDILSKKHAMCGDCFWTRYGIAYEAYIANRLRPNESPAKTAIRLKNAEDKKLKSETSGFVTSNDIEKQETKQPEPEMDADKEEMITLTLFIPPTMLARVEEQARQQFRTPEQQIAWYLYLAVRADI